MTEATVTPSLVRLGDVVKLFSGGPLMTVKETAGSMVRCTWFDKQNVPCEHVFHEYQLFGADINYMRRLVSGGPEMSYAGDRGDNTLCVWFDKDGNVCEREFPKTALTHL